MSKFLFLTGVFLLTTCSTIKKTGLESKNTAESIALESKKGEQYLSEISAKNLKAQMQVFASDDFEGRSTGKEGQRKAAKFIKDYYVSNKITSPEVLDYFQDIPKDFFNNRSEENAANVMGFIKGSKKPEEIVVISAHYDHLGKKDSKVYNGADDNGSGTLGILQIASAFQKAVKNGDAPKRSILFLHFVGEEIGLYGSRFYVENPVFNLTNTVADLNIDMIGRVDKKHQENPNYLYIIGSDKLSKELHLINEAVNTKYNKLDFDYTFNDDNDPNRFYYRSDHYNFAKNNIPVIFYFNGTHNDYHKPTDTLEKIDYNLLKKRCDHVFLVAWELANRKERLKLD